VKNRALTYLLMVAVLSTLAAACSKQVNKRVTLWRNDKIPYGTHYAYQNLHHIFENAYIETSDESPVTFYEDGDTAAAYIVVANSVIPDDNEMSSLINYAMSGNHVFISALRISETLLDSFDLKSTSLPAYLLRNDSMVISLADPYVYDSINFSYPGYDLGNYFTGMDSSVTQVLGKDAEGNANFVKLRYQNGGAIYFHLAPAAFTNFFLLHKENAKYYNLALSSIPNSVEFVRWDDYFRHHSNGRDNADQSAFSKLGTFLSNEVLRWAFWLTLLLFALVYLVESKRKQRVIPSIKKLNNSSLDFVKTVGRLYYQRKDNKNLAQKISAHFLGHIRNTYNLSTSQLDERFEEKLAYKSGQPLLEVKEVVGQVRELDLMYEMSDEELLAFNNKIDKFINKA
jgi:hypothetical protein